MKMIIALLLILALVVGWVYYEKHDGANTLGNGAITARDGGPVDKSNDNPAINESHATTAENPSAQTVGTGAVTSQPFNQNAQTATLASTAAAPPSDNSQAPNAPDQLRFAGNGRYQWYRQGDLTWRIDTVSGATCIDFATMPEWRKPIVISHGCGNIEASSGF
ncbi:MAG: hypothetical protein V4555_06370 [Acidobacteriota bacterium]